MGADIFFGRWPQGAGRKEMTQGQTKAIQTSQATEVSPLPRPVLRIVQIAPWGCARVALGAGAMPHCPSTSPAHHHPRPPAGNKGLPNSASILRSTAALGQKHRSMPLLEAPQQEPEEACGGDCLPAGLDQRWGKWMWVRYQTPAL